MEKRHTEGANRDIEAAQGEAEHEQEAMGKIQGEKGKMLVMGKVFRHPCLSRLIASSIRDCQAAR